MDRRIVGSCVFDDVWRQGKIYAKDIYCTAWFREPFLVFTEHLIYTSRCGRSKLQVGTTGPLPHYQKGALKEPPTKPKRRSTRIFPLTALTSRSQFTLIRLSTVTGRSRFTPIRPMAGSAVYPDRPESVHTDPAHGWFSRIFVPMLSFILNTPPQAQLEAFGLSAWIPSGSMPCLRRCRRS
jgi:hypothetical protein